MCRDGQAPISIYEEAWQEAFRHKWIESEKHRHDRGHRALVDWDQQYFKTFIRWCRLQHLSGQRCFREFRCEDFGAVAELAGDVDCKVIHLFCSGKENLEIYWLAHGQGWPLERVYELLLSLDINACRLKPLVR